MSHDDAKEIVEVVRYPARKGTQALHFLRLNQLQLQLALLRDVSDKPANDGEISVTVLDRRRTHDNIHPGTIFSFSDEFKLVHNTLFRQLPKELFAIVWFMVDVIREIQ